MTKKKMTILISRFLIILNVFILLFSLSVFGQSQIEQLEAKLSSAQTAEKPSIYNQLAQHYLESNASKSLENATKALATSKENKIGRASCRERV